MKVSQGAEKFLESYMEPLKVRILGLYCREVTLVVLQ